MKKYYKTVIVIVILAVLGIAYYYYLSNRDNSVDATEKEYAKQEIEALTTRDLSSNYPESPKEVIKFYARITRAYYKTEISDEQMKLLGTQARKLFDKELYDTQTDDEFFEALKKDIEEYRKADRYVADYKIDDSENVNYSTFEGKKYASVKMLYNIREGSELINSYTKFTLRQDEAGRWRILFWELIQQ